jgi:prepilin-type N-terminal cleavage/methylation domain-containing protein
MEARRHEENAPGRRAGGFTLLEVLLALALVSILGGFLVLDWSGLAGAFARPSPRESVQEVFRSAHYLAERREQAMWIRPAAETEALEVVDAESGAVLLQQPVPGLRSFHAVEREGATSAARSSSLRRRGDEGRMVRIGPEGVGEGTGVVISLGRREFTLRHDPFSGALLTEDGEPWGAGPS